MDQKVVATSNAPAAIGPYSQAIVCGDFVFSSGQIPLNTDGVIVGTTIEDQTRQVLINLGRVLEAAGSALNKVVKTTVFITDMNEFSAFNQVYAEFFKENLPARSTVQVARLPKDVKVEIEAVASL